MRKFVLLVIFQLSFSLLQAQQKYWIYLNDKNPHIKNRSGTEILDHLHEHNVEPVIYSEWLNAVSAYIPESFRLPADSCMLRKEVTRGMIGTSSVTTYGEEDRSYDAVIRQINGHVLTEAGFTGKGIKIGVIDAGFLNADKHRFLRGLIENKQVKGFRNFIETDDDDIYTKDYHGTQVLVHLAGSRDGGSRMQGMATDAWFYLARTDQDDKEYRAEEDYWVAALEWMHAQGVQIVNSSLGYSDGYDDPSSNYSPSQADGVSTAIARAATIAVQQKGMLLVISAGNEGNRQFRVLSIPGDAEGVLTVGASTLNWPWTKLGYSSIGTPGLEWVKPDVTCYAFNGTSYAAPVITGLAAAVWEARPDLDNQQVSAMIRESSHLSVSPNNYLGFGVPDGRRLLAMIRNSNPQSPGYKELRPDAEEVTLPASPDELVIYHKDSSWNVISEMVVRENNEPVTVSKPANVTRTSVVSKTGVTEILWTD